MNKQERFWIEVSRDHFTAYLHVSPDAGDDVAVKEVLERAREMGIVHGIKDDEKIQSFLDNIELYDYVFIIASGKPFTLGEDARIVFNFECDPRAVLEAEAGPSEDIDFRQIGAITSVNQGDVVAKRIPATQGEGGMTIFGQKLPGEWGTDITIEAGENVELADDKDYIAKIGGAPFVSGGVIRVDPVTVIDGNVDYGTGNIEFAGTVVIKGSIMDGFDVRAGGDIIVENTIQMANVHAGGDVVVKRGILTRGKGAVVSSDGSVYARFIENSTVEAEGNVVVETAIMNSDVRANGSVVALNREGAIIGGQTLAFDRVAARVLGSTAHPKTYVQAGYRHDVQKKYLETLGRLGAISKELAKVKKDYDHVSKTSNDFDKLGELRTAAHKLLKAQKEIQSDLAEIGATRIFNHLALVDVEDVAYPGATVLIGEGRYIVRKETKYASFKWDSEAKNSYLASFDEAGKELRTTKPGRGNSVLIIDDSKAVRKTLKLILEKIGMRVAGEAEDGEEGVEQYRQLRPSIVTLDIAMVRMDGIETLREIRKINSNAKVIMISSIRDRRKVLDCVMAGSLDYILKPFVPKKVIATVRSALQS
ncbi:MAG: FapA family protein [bacterium]